MLADDSDQGKPTAAAGAALACASGGTAVVRRSREAWPLLGCWLGSLGRHRTTAASCHSGLSLVFNASDAPPMVFNASGGLLLVFKASNAFSLVFNASDGPSLVFNAGDGLSLFFNGNDDLSLVFNASDGLSLVFNACVGL